MNMMVSPPTSPAHQQQCRLAALNRLRLTPKLPDEADPVDMAASLAEEAAFLNAARRRVAVAASAAPTGAKDFVHWFERLALGGPGQGDPLFSWLATECSLSQMRWFLAQEVAGEAGFDDLTAMTLVGMPVRPKLELARNFWDEMGRGGPRGMHGPMLQALAKHLDLDLPRDAVVWQALALANTMTGLAATRHYAFHSVGALGVVELTAPGRAAQVAAGLRRLGVPGDVGRARNGDAADATGMWRRVFCAVSGRIRLPGTALIDTWVGRKYFFFEKKKQKTFDFGSPYRAKVFGSFFQKRTASFASTFRRAIARPRRMLSASPRSSG